MTLTEAYRMLGLSQDCSPEETRKSYRNLMRQFHPDSRGDEQEAHRLAQEINEAYRLVKIDIRDRGKSDPDKDIWMKARSARSHVYDWRNIDPGIPLNPAAFCDRKLYMQDEMLGMEHIIDTGLKGRFYWDPELETFGLLLRSVNMEVTKILSGMELEEVELLRLRSGLLHLLLQEFIHPMQLLDSYPSIRKDGEAYVVTAELKAAGKLTQLTYDVLADKSRLYAVESSAAENKKVAGQVTFVENALYYIVTPLIMQGVVKAKIRVTQQTGRTLKWKLYMTLTGKSYQDMTLKINAEIRKRLDDDRHK